MPPPVLIAHADGEEAIAEKLAQPLRSAGYSIVHRGTALVGESITEHFAKALAGGGAVVLCGTIRAAGTPIAHHLVNAAKPFAGKRVFAVRMEREAYLELVAPDIVVAEYWKDPVGAIQQLIAALLESFP